MTNPWKPRILGMPSRGAAHAVALGVAIGLALVAAPRAQAQNLTTLYSFCSQTNCTDGANPYVGLVQGSDGNFYGTTGNGGASGYGAVFKITPSGVLTTIYSFSGGNDGLYPYAGLVQGSDGNFYGTTVEGGASGYGTIFKITPSGVLTTIYSFSGGNDGLYPKAGLVQGSDGNFYGTMELNMYWTYQGRYPVEVYGSGTVFQITPSGGLTNLYQFCMQTVPGAICPDGKYPYAGLILGSDGSFYGTTVVGGGANVPCPWYGEDLGCGTIFKITPSGG